MATETATSSAAIVEQLNRIDSARLRAYRDNIAFYRGQQWASLANRRERRLVFNYARALIDKTASYLMAGLRFVVDEEDGSEAERERVRRAEKALRTVYEANSLSQLDFDSEIDTSTLGDGAFKVTWDPLERQVHVSAPDVQGVFVWWSGDDVSRAWRVASRYYLSHEEAQLLYGSAIAAAARPLAGGRIASQTPRRQHTVVEVWTAAEFELWFDGSLIESKRNPYGFIPFVIYPNLREPKQFWGVSDLEAVREPVRELNRALSQLSMILELSGNPVAVLENVTESHDIAVEPGAVWELPERARAYLLDLLQGRGVNLHVEYINLLYRTLHDLSEAPRTSFGDSGRNLSGVALNIELDPLLKKVQRKRLLREVALRRRNEMILRLLEQYTGVSYAPYRSRVVWAPLLPIDHSRLVTDETRLVAAGIHSRRRAAASSGRRGPRGRVRALAAGGAAAGGAVANIGVRRRVKTRLS